MLSTEKHLRARRFLLAAVLVFASWAILPAHAEAAVCGNGPPGFPEAGEQCDDGNLINGDGCSAFCTIEACGNGSVDVGIGPFLGDNEQCDPATGVFSFRPGSQANANIATCTWDCKLSTCGDNFVNGVAGETCDLGAANTATCDGASALLQKCTARVCGDGYSNSVGGEACDDGNLTNNDGCDSNCKPTACGNGVTAGSELCDDGNLVNNDGCDNNCKFTGCGNGVVTAGEQCDDGNNVSGDLCSATCTIEQCGNGIVDLTENCDPPNNVTCANNCTYIHCGDNIVTNNETCDPGTGNGPDTLTAAFDSATCDKNCTLQVCGDGYTNIIENCDPATIGGTIPYPVYPGACGSNCAFGQCGDGVLSPGLEQCDPGTGAVGGNGVPGASAILAVANTATCDVNCTNRVCGDGYTNGTVEFCDPGTVGGFIANPVYTQACDSNCKFTGCGDGVVNPPTEQCDPGTGFGAVTTIAVSGPVYPVNSCDYNCKSPLCGNGATTGTEQCDDGNLASGDGCDSNCKVTACGNGIKTAGEECDDGNVIAGDGCNSLCGDETCGNGIVAGPPGYTEQCDDGNVVQADGCTNACMSDPDQDGLLYGPDVCNALDYTIPAASPPDQNPAKVSLKLSGLDQVGKHDISFKGEFNPDQLKVCSGDPLNLVTCTTDASCLPSPGGTCGPPNPTKTGVFIQLRNGGNLLYSLSVAGDNQAPGGEYIRRSPSPACGNKSDGWTVISSKSGKVTFGYANRSGRTPNYPSDTIEGTCTGSAKGLRSLTLVYDPAHAKWTYTATVSNTTLNLLPTIAGSGNAAALQNTLQLEVALGYDGVAHPQGSVGQCFDNQYRGSGPGGTGSVSACKVGLRGASLYKVTCK